MKQRGAPGRLSRAWAWLLLVLHPVIPVAWVAAAVFATISLPGLGEGATAALEDVVAEDSTALATQVRSAQLFGSPLATDIAIVMHDPQGLEQSELRGLLAGARESLSGEVPPELEGLRGAVPVLNAPVPGLDWPQTNTTAITYLGFDPGRNLGSRRRLAEAYVGRYLDPAPGTQVGVTGATPARLAQFDAIEDALPLVTVASVVLVALIVGLHFRSVGAPLVTLAGAGIAYLVTVRVLGWAGRERGLLVPREVEPVIVVLLLGLVTDYTIFFLSGMRASLARGLGRHAAMREATMGTSRIVLTAGLIVAAGTAALVAGKLDFFEAFGPGLALCALVSLAVCLTFIPAMMALFGRRLFGRLPKPEEAREAPEEPPPVRLSNRLPAALRGRAAIMATALRRTRHAAREEGRSRWRVIGSRLLASRPVALPVVAVTIGLLAISAAPALKLDLGLNFLNGLPPGEPARIAADNAAAGFAPGILSPTELLVEDPGVTGRRPQLARLEELIARRPGVAAVVGPREEVASLGIDVTLARTGDAARMAVVLSAAPDSTEAIDIVESLEEDLPGLLADAGLGGASAALAGETMLAAETVEAVSADLVRIALAALAANVVLLAIFMRAIVAPLYLLAGSVLAFASGLGITLWILDTLGHGGGLTYFVPLATAVLLVSLGSDYNVFVAGRIWDEARRRRLREAVAVAAPRAAGAITVAGITLAATFALLALVPLRSFREFALLMVVGVLVDALVVRSVLIPGLVSLFGELSWWPGRRVRPADLKEFVGVVSERAGVELGQAERLSQATLTTLRERIDRTQARSMARQLPEALAPTMDPPASRSSSSGFEEFTRRVAERAGTEEAQARYGAIAVLAAVREVVDETTVAYVRAQLPADHEPLFAPAATGSPAPGEPVEDSPAAPTGRTAQDTAGRDPEAPSEPTVNERSGPTPEDRPGLARTEADPSGGDERGDSAS